MPAYRFLGASGGSGPLVRFERPSTAAKYGLHEEVVFQKGLHGANWFRVNLVPMFEGSAAVGTMRHALWEGETTGSDVRWDEPRGLEPLIVEACRALEKRARTFFTPFEKAAPRYAKVLGRLVEHYTAWLGKVGETLPSGAFKEDSGGQVPAFEAFQRWLGGKKLTAGLKGALETCLWRFWNEGRPMRQSDYDKSDYYYSSKCPAFIRPTRGRFAKHRVTGFGDHFALVCAKHRTSAQN